MQKAKKLLSVILMLCIVASIAVGCASTPAPASDTPSGSAGDASQADNTPKETVTLEVWFTGTPQDQADRVEQAINDYLKNTLNSNIQVNIEELGWNDEYTQRVNNALSTGQAVDVVFTANWCANVQQNALQGNFLDLTNYLAANPEISEILGEDFINGSKIKGVNYALPCNKEKFHNWGFLLRKDLVDKYNIDLTTIKSTKDLEPYFDKVLAEETGITPIAIQGMDVPDWKFLDWDNISDDDVPGALYPTSDGSSKTIINQFTAPESIAVYKTMKEYLKKGYISPDAASAPGVSDLLNTGKYFAAVQSLKPGKDAEMTQSTGIEYVQVDITKAYKTNRETTGAMLAIPTHSKHPDEAFQFIKLLYTDANILNLIVFGQENIDYTKNADGTISTISGSGYASGNGWRFGDQFKQYLLDIEDPEKWNKWKSINDSAPALYSLGFMFDNNDTNVQTLIANNRAVTQEYYKTFLSGQANDVDALVKEMEAKYKAAGVDDLLKVMQEQFDAWVAANK